MSLLRVDSVLDPAMPKVRPPLSFSELCEDVILMICDHLNYMRTDCSTSIKNLSLTNRHFRSLLIPRLFKTLKINQPISQLIPTLLLHHAQTFNIDMFGSMWWWCSGSYTSSTDALDLFRCIQSLQHLKALEISMMRRSIDMFTAAFEDEKLDATSFILDRVEKLVVTSSAAFLTSHCPNLQSIVIEDGLDCLVETYTDLTRRITPLYSGIIIHSTSPSLIHFDAMATWSAEELAALVSSFPGLQRLRMRTDTYCYRVSTPTIIEVLSKGLTDLKILHLVRSGSLDMGYQSVWKRRIQACSDDEYRRALWAENERLRVHVENEIARLAFGKIANLSECWMGEKRVARKLQSDAGDELKWLWERKREDSDACDMGSPVFARFGMEKEAVVVGSEIGM